MNMNDDCEARKSIVTDINNSNFFVEAGAGSGKTTVLVERMVSMIEAGIDISKICAITYTKAAASEFYQRFQKLLIERSSIDWKDEKGVSYLPAPTEVSCKRCADALPNIDMCFMGTIHSFCEMILSEHPSEAQLPADFSIISDSDMEEFCKKEYVRIHSGEYGEDLRKQAQMFAERYSSDIDKFLGAISQVMSNRNADFCLFIDSTDECIKKYGLEAFKKDFLPALKLLCDNMSDIANLGNEASRTAWEDISEDYNAINTDWDSNLNAVFASFLKIKNLTVLKTAKLDGALSLLNTFLDAEFTAKTGKISKYVWNDNFYKLADSVFTAMYAQTIKFLYNCSLKIEENMKKSGYLTYFDSIYYLKQMLYRDIRNNGGELVKHIASKYGYYMIDEYQDTNPMQAEIFFYLASENPVEAWEKCIPRKGSLFIVGDPKQSIYRFAGADISSYMTVKKLFTGDVGKVLKLTRNFRSTGILCEYFNVVFDKLMPSDTNYQSKFEAIPVSNSSALNGEFTGVFTYVGDLSHNPDKGLDGELDCVQVRKIISTLVDNDLFKISDTDKNGNKILRKITFADFMIIYHNKKYIIDLQKEFNKYGIPMKIEGNVDFAGNLALIDIATIYDAAINNTSFSILRALTNSLFGFNEKDVLSYSHAANGLSIYSEEVKDAKGAILEIGKAIATIRKIHNASKHLSPAGLFEMIIDECNLFSHISIDNLEVVYYTLELLRNESRTRTVVSHKDASKFLNDCIAGNSKEERCLSLNYDKDCVHVANLHKVKGLERPIVILAATKMIKKDPSVRYEREPLVTSGYLLSLCNKDEKSFALADKQEEEKNALADELTRLLYVAATRARNALFICYDRSLERSNSRELTLGTNWGDLFQNINWNPSYTEPKDFFIYAQSQNITIVKDKNFDVRESKNSADLLEESKNSSVLNSRECQNATYKVMKPSDDKEESKSESSNNKAGDTTSSLSDTSKTDFADDTSATNADTSSNADSGKKIKFTLVHKYPQLYGTMVHKLMELLLTSRNKVSVDLIISDIMNSYDLPDDEKIIEAFELALKTIAATMTNGGFPQKNGVSQDILSVLLDESSSCEFHCEIPFSYEELDNGSTLLWNGIVDLAYCKDGVWHIIDWKTNYGDDNLDEEYEEQLKAYIKAFKSITGIDVADAHTYHIVY